MNRPVSLSFVLHKNLVVQMHYFLLDFLYSDGDNIVHDLNALLNALGLS